MTAKERIGKLQGLLARVQMRAQAPRSNGAVHSAELRAASSHSVEVTEIEPVEQLDSLPPISDAPDTAHSLAPAAPDTYASSYDDADVEVSSETVEVDIDIDEPMAMESGAQPVAQPTMPPEELEEVESPSPPPQQEVAQMAPANEIEEPAPSSSRRPIAGEEPAETYGEESAPRHTPPPESGKQVAAPSVHPAARGPEPSFGPEAQSASASINPSAPPPSLEGHTLIGGWREPGLGGPQIGPPAVPGVTTGVRVPPAAKVASAPVPQASGTRLSPEVTRPELVATDGVAQFESPAAVLKPTTMGELLELTLSL